MDVNHMKPEEEAVVPPSASKNGNDGGGEEQNEEAEPIHNNTTPKPVISEDHVKKIDGEDTSPSQRAWDKTDCKVLVHSVDKFMNSNKIKKLTEKWMTKELMEQYPDFQIVKTKKPPKDAWMQVTLNRADYVAPFIAHLAAQKFVNKKGRTMYATTVDPTSNSNSSNGESNKRGNENDENGRDGKRQRREGDEAAPNREPRDVRDVVTPLWKLPYPDQLQTKQRQMINKSIIKVVKEIKNKFRNINVEAKRNKNVSKVQEYEWLRNPRPVNVDDILPAPGLLRNKCEFNFGYQCALELPTPQEGEEPPKIPAVGFHSNGWAGGVSSPHSCQNIPDAACAVVELVNEFLQKHPELPPYDSKVHRGFWRILTIRTSPRTGQCMLIFVHGPVKGAVGAQDESDDYTSVFESCKQELVEILTKSDLVPTKAREYGDERQPFPESSEPLKLPDKPIRVTSIFFQEYEGLSHPSPECPVQHVYGQTAMEEILGKCTFRISPGAFFQVNTPGAENLYGVAVNKVREVTKDPSNTILLDVCCGTGTIGLTCMKEGVCGKVVGVDISEPAIEDAKQNATLNGYTDPSTTKFVAGRAEHVLQQECRAIPKGTPVVAVVDPAREGLHQLVVRTLRGNKSIQRIVYVSCNPTGSFINDAGLLCSPPTKRYGGVPFMITSAQPVDMFPLTDHCEMVFTFDRIPSADGDDKDDDDQEEETSTTEQGEKSGASASEAVDGS